MKNIILIAAAILVLAASILTTSAVMTATPPDPFSQPPCFGNKVSESEQAFNITPAERDILAKLVWNEAGLCSQECQEAIVSVVFNMINSGYFGDTIEAVVFRKNAFVGALYMDTATPNAQCYAAVDAVCANGITIPSDVMYFRNNHHFTWDGYEGVMELDDVFFGHFINGNH